MRTDNLIELLAQDDTPARPIPPQVLAVAGLALMVAGTIALSILGIRGDLFTALSDRVTLMKWLLPLGLGLPALWAALRLSQPQTRRVPAATIPAALAVVAAIWWAVSAVGAAPGTLWPLIRGNSLYICLTAITLISVLPLAAGLWVLRQGASPNPTRSGAMIGLAAGGMAAATYALHCNEDAPLFFLTWYGLAIVIVTAAGALLGRRLLRW